MNLFEVFDEEIDEDFQDVCSQWDALRLAGLVEAEVHEERRGILQAVHVEVGPGEILGDQPGDEAAGQQGPPDDESVVISFSVLSSQCISKYLMQEFRRQTDTVTYLRLSFCRAAMIISRVAGSMLLPTNTRQSTRVSMSVV